VREVDVARKTHRADHEVGEVSPGATRQGTTVSRAPDQADRAVARVIQWLKRTARTAANIHHRDESAFSKLRFQNSVVSLKSWILASLSAVRPH
jgi:hypothetical protein